MAHYNIHTIWTNVNLSSFPCQTGTRAGARVPRQGRKNIAIPSYSTTAIKFSDFLVRAKIRFLRPKFRNLGVMEKARLGFFITLLFRNVRSWYSRTTKPWPIWVDQSWGFFILGPLKRADSPRTPIFYRSSVAKSWTKIPVPVILFGVTTLQVMCMDTSASDGPQAGPEKCS